LQKSALAYSADFQHGNSRRVLKRKTKILERISMRDIFFDTH
jgi:hypothetical protein